MYRKERVYHRKYKLFIKLKNINKENRSLDFYEITGIPYSMRF